MATHARPARIWVTQTATMVEIATMMGWTMGYARKVASREAWRRSGWPRRYDLRDVARHAVARGLR